MKTVDILVAARDRVARRWIQGEMNNHGAVCSLGAIEVATKPIAKAAGYESDVLDYPRYSRAVKYLAHAIGIPERNHTAQGTYAYPGFIEDYDNVVVNFNDAEGRKKAEVLAAFDKAITNARRRHVTGA